MRNSSAVRKLLQGNNEMEEHPHELADREPDQVIETTGKPMPQTAKTSRIF